jgi:hypothetical protein
MKIHVRQEVEGFFKIEAIRVDADGEEISRRLCADWFPNLILDTGLDRMGTASFANGCAVGSGNSTPTNGQTVLDTFVAGTSNITSTTASVQGSAPYYGYSRRIYRFATGVAAGNLSEVGTSQATGTPISSSLLFNRALIVDGSGTPTTITVLSDEILDVTYECRSYPAIVDVTDTDTINGNATDIIVRASNVTNARWGDAIFDSPAFTSGALYTGDIGAITAGPSGTLLGITTTGTSLSGGLTGSYSAGSYTRNYFTLTNTGHSWTIGAANFITGRGEYQVDWEPKVTLLTTQTFRVEISITWARKTLP